MWGILRGPPVYSVSAWISCSALGLGEPTTPIWSQVSSELSLLFCFSPAEALSFSFTRSVLPPKPLFSETKAKLQRRESLQTTSVPCLHHDPPQKWERTREVSRRQSKHHMALPYPGIPPKATMLVSFKDKEA